MKEEVVSYLQSKYHEYSRQSIGLLNHFVTEILAKMGGNVIKTHYKREELLNEPGEGGSEEGSIDAEVVNVISPNLMNKSMAIYKKAESVEEQKKAAPAKVEKAEKEEKVDKVEKMEKSEPLEENKPLTIEKKRKLRAEVMDSTKKVKKEKEENKGHSITSTLTFKDMGGISVINSITFFL